MEEPPPNIKIDHRSVMAFQVYMTIVANGCVSGCTEAHRAYVCAHVGMCNVAVSRGMHGVYMATRVYMAIGCMEDMHGHWDVEGEYKAY